MKTLLMFLLCGLLITEALGQSVVQEMKLAREIAQQHIKSLKNGALLVRLKTRDKSLEAYRAAGAEELAKRIEQEQFEENLRTFNVFTEFFDFCPVYFFYANQTKQVLSGETKGNLLNEYLQPDSTIQLLTDTFYIAEIDVLYETLPDEDEEFDETLQDENIHKAKNRHAETTLQNVIVIKDRNLVQLKRPFPFYVRTMLDRFLPSKVAKFNLQLHKFYANAN